ncbi:hypothetical protein [Virgisporangium aurantiacum]|uniref:Uncharacterized protein n=1 Tax=Virgisporangium aurantiacum TaxID=175570 RepID=A0A8J4E7T8_9ACTN|nr:hypothetical protein [Virgisporangium aurantiacum]GIJ62112.1 hypothetical protein Vau01_096280 [Virgisporangium aurantiacum]
MAAIEEQLRRAADLLSQPLLLEVLAAVEAGGTPSDALTDEADRAAFDAAVERLTAMGVLGPVGSDDSGPAALTPRGEELLVLLNELAQQVPPAARAGHEQ